MAELKLLHQRTFEEKLLRSFSVYDDPFGDYEICIELAFEDGHIECISIGSSKPMLKAVETCYELRRPKQRQVTPVADSSEIDQHSSDTRSAIGFAQES